jgi:site-specific DNA recombinase
MRVPAGDIEMLVLDRLRAFVSSRVEVSDALTPLDLEARAFDAALGNAFTLSKRWLAMPPVEMKTLVLDIVERVTIAANRIDIWLNRAKIAAALEAGGGSQRPDIDPVVVSIEAKLRRGGKGKRLVIANGAPDIVRALLEGRQPIELTPTRLLRLSKDLPHDWSEQRHVLDFAA